MARTSDRRADAPQPRTENGLSFLARRARIDRNCESTDAPLGVGKVRHKGPSTSTRHGQGATVNGDLDAIWCEPNVAAQSAQHADERTDIPCRRLGSGKPQQA